MILCCFGRTPFRNRQKGREGSPKKVSVISLFLSPLTRSSNDAGSTWGFPVSIPNRDQVGEIRDSPIQRGREIYEVKEKHNYLVCLSKTQFYSEIRCIGLSNWTEQSYKINKAFIQKIIVYFLCNNNYFWTIPLFGRKERAGEKNEISLKKEKQTAICFE